MNAKNSINTEADALNASLSLTPAQATAQKLVEQWASRLAALKQQPAYFVQEIVVLSACRRELQAAFGLGSLGSAPQPPSDSESSSA